jgi:hypothetical protein
MNKLIRVEDIIINLENITLVDIHEAPDAPTYVDIYFVGGAIRTLTGEQAERFLNAVMRQTGNRMYDFADYNRIWID